jgi:hypothetical protein
MKLAIAFGPFGCTFINIYAYIYIHKAHNFCTHIYIKSNVYIYIHPKSCTLGQVQSLETASPPNPRAPHPPHLWWKLLLIGTERHTDTGSIMVGHPKKRKLASNIEHYLSQ